ncbi:site-2 protease family protein [Bradyrhizobium icense]|uniref:Zinc metalloprotease n=1 Tax=Bradyrhizobium icense TaxID=1274631 RepID=A0A1B1UDT0_9BRAD|nr:site-2 protease family protein [Bradyrhizobium icense]ANW00901.1 hypothetical protein LMTR13_12685 [Bradyrhizobium icense]
MFDRSLTLFRLFGFRVGIDASWLLLAVLIVWTLSVGYFPQSFPGREPASYWAMGVAGLLGLAVSIVLHELAHAVVARRYDMPIRGITLFVFGGVAEMEDEPTSAKGEFLMAVAGPIMSLGLAVFFYLLVLLVPGGVSIADGEMALSAHAVVLLYLAGINCILAIFNVVPAFPLDGGRMLRAALWAWSDDILWATRIAARAGWAFGFLLMAAGLFAFVTGSVVGGIWWFILGLFVQMAASSHLEHHVRRSILAGIPVSAVMRRDPISVAPALTLDRLLDEYFLRHYFKEFPVVDDRRLVGCVSLEALRDKAAPTLARQQVSGVMQVCGEDNTISPETDASRALYKMQRGRRDHLLVARDGQLVGVLSLRDLLSYLGIRQELEQLTSRDGRAGTIVARRAPFASRNS